MKELLSGSLPRAAAPAVPRRIGPRRRSWRFVAVAGFALATGLAISGGAQPRSAVREGGTFRVALPVSAVESIDPFLNNLVGFVPVFDAMCASLLHRRDEALPAGSRLVPELAESLPVVSSARTTYTFKVKRGQRFSNGMAVTARDVAATVRRALRLKGSYPAGDLMDIVGAPAFERRLTTTLPGVTAKGNAVTFRLTKPRPDFAAIAGELCVLPRGLPLNPEGVSAPVPTAGPYTLIKYITGRQIVLERNRFYHGPRRPHADRYDITLLNDDSTLVEDVERGTYDYAFIRPPVISSHVQRLTKRYGVNGRRFFVTQGRGIWMLVLNASQPLFHENPKLRRAVNFAIDRNELVREAGAGVSVAADQYLQPHQFAYRDTRIYPFTPDLRRAQELARGNTRGGKAVFYTRDEPDGRAYGAIVKDNLEEIGLRVEVKPFPRQLTFELLQKRGEPWDIGLVFWGYAPPEGLSLHGWFDGRTLDDPEHFNWSHFNSPRVNRRLDQISTLDGPAFREAYGELDVELARDFAPAVAFSYVNELTLVSARTGCVVNHPSFDLAVACLT